CDASSICKQCANSGPCGSCGGTTQCDGSCSKPTPSDFGTVRDFNSFEHDFACCFIDDTLTFGSNCDQGWVFQSVDVTRTSGGGSCDLMSQGHGTDCRVTVRFHNNGTEGAKCRVTIHEQRVCDQ